LAIELFISKDSAMQKAKILIVEDDGIVALDIERRLKNFGYSVPAVVSNAEEAMQKLQEHQPDLVLMDIVIKGETDGIEAARIIRARFNIPVYFLRPMPTKEGWSGRCLRRRSAIFSNRFKTGILKSPSRWHSMRPKRILKERNPKKN